MWNVSSCFGLCRECHLQGGAFDHFISGHVERGNGHPLGSWSMTWNCTIRFLYQFLEQEKAMLKILEDEKAMLKILHGVTACFGVSVDLSQCGYASVSILVSISHQKRRCHARFASHRQKRQNHVHLESHLTSITIRTCFGKSLNSPLAVPLIVAMLLLVVFFWLKSSFSHSQQHIWNRTGSQVPTAG